MRLAEKKRISAAGKLQRSSFLFRGLTLLLATAIFASATFAWIAINNKTQSGDIGVMVDDDRFSVEFTYYKYDVNTSIVTSSADLSAIEFNQYDLVFRSRNRYTPIVVRMAVSGEAIPSSGTITARIIRDTSKPSSVEINSKTQLSQFSTSVMRFTPYKGTLYSAGGGKDEATNTFNSIDTQQHFDVVRSLVGDDLVGTGSQVFTSVDLTENTINSVTKDEYIDLEYDYTELDFVNGVLYLYIYITYDEGINEQGINNGLVGIYQSTSGLTVIGEKKVTFDYDLESIIVRHN